MDYFLTTMRHQKTPRLDILQLTRWRISSVAAMFQPESLLNVPQSAICLQGASLSICEVVNGSTWDSAASYQVYDGCAGPTGSAGSWEICRCQSLFDWSTTTSHARDAWCMPTSLTRHLLYVNRLFSRFILSSWLVFLAFFLKKTKTGFIIITIFIFILGK